MAYRNLKHYRHTVHLYLDSIWPISTNKKKARTTMYKWLALQMGIDYYKCHVKWFTRDQCRQAIKILRAKHIQLYGKDIPWEEAKKRMEQEKMEEMEELANDLSGSYWNYRWLKIIQSFPEYDEEGNLTGNTEYEAYYELHEVYYDNDEKPFMWTEDCANLLAENALDLMELVRHALDAAMKPVLLLTKGTDDDDLDKIEELNEYIDGKEELDKWLANKQD